MDAVTEALHAVGRDENRCTRGRVKRCRGSEVLTRAIRANEAYFVSGFHTPRHILEQGVRAHLRERVDAAC